MGFRCVNFCKNNIRVLFQSFRYIWQKGGNTIENIDSALSRNEKNNVLYTGTSLKVPPSNFLSMESWSLHSPLVVVMWLLTTEAQQSPGEFPKKSQNSYSS
jgi:hypothetical protein